MSLRKAINDKCKDCIYDPLDSGTWREQVGACTSDDCALWPYRPKSRPARTRTQTAAVHDASGDSEKETA